MEIEKLAKTQRIVVVEIENQINVNDDAASQFSSGDFGLTEEAARAGRPKIIEERGY